MYKSVVLRAVLAGSLVGAVTAGLPSSAFGFAVATTTPTSKTIQRWFSNNVTYYLHPACSPDIKNDVCKDQLRAGFTAWTAQSCTSLKFLEGYHCNTALKKCLFDKNVACNVDTDCPAANNLNVLPMGYNTNGRNELVFVEGSNWKFGQYTLGVTSPVTYNNGSIVESDIAFNGYHYKWVADPGAIGNSLMDILSVGIHEQGHFFGVQHMLPGSYKDNDPPTMAPSVDPFGKSATLTADDAKVICFLNPKDTQYKCTVDTDCPYVNEKDNSTGKEYFSAKLVCATGACSFGGSTTPVGSAELGGTCSTDKDCKSGLFCQPYGTKGYCSQSCSPQQKNCPTGFNCFAYQGQPTKGACLPAQNQTQPTKDAGDVCGSSAECKSLMCLSNVCRVKCTPSAPVECNKNTETCAPIPATGIGACVPDTKPKLKAAGVKCDAPAECESSLCLKEDAASTSGVCRAACKGKFSCPEGFACVPQTGGFEACLPGTDKLPAGSACATPGECANGPCVAFGGQQFCSQTCTVDQAGSCPCGMNCENSTAGNLCLPGKKKACAELGNQCADSAECVSGTLCLDKVCGAGCDVRSGSNCGAGQGCRRIEPNTPQGVCWAAGKGLLSDACTADADCQSLFCDVDITNNNEQRCLRPCDPDDDQCGLGFACNAVTEYVGGCFSLEDLKKHLPTADAGATADTTGANGGAIDGGNGAGSTTTSTAGTTTSNAGLCSANRTTSHNAWAGLLVLAIGAGLAVFRRRLYPN